MILKRHDVLRMAGTVKAIRPGKVPRFAVFCMLTLFNTLHRPLFRNKPFILEINDKLFELRIGKGEYDFLYETNIRRVYEPSVDFIPGPFQVAVDVGANFGSTAIQWHRSLTRGVIYAIEPHPETFQGLLRNIELNRAQEVIKPSCIALGAKNGMLSVYLTEAGSMAMKTRSAALDSRRVRVPCMTLDSFAEKEQLDHIDLLKIDVEGFEVDVLKGAARMLQKTDRVALEHHSPELKERCASLLSESGFDLVLKDALIFARKKQSPVR